MITPTIGRVIWVFRPGDSVDVKQPEVGFITYIHSDRCINVAGFNANGTPFSLTSLTLVQLEDEKPEWNFAAWMPYQKGQAAKTEQAEAELAVATAIEPDKTV